MKIQAAKTSDATPITALTIRSKAHWGYSEAQMDAWWNELTIKEAYIQQNEVYMLVAEGELIGFYAYQSLDNAAVKLNFLFIEPTYIGQGFGNALLTDFLGRVKRSGFQKVTLDADPNAEAFYRRLGFQVVGQLKSLIKDRFLPIMEKELIAF